MSSHFDIPTKQKAIVLAGGGALGAYQVGAIKVLAKDLLKEDKKNEKNGLLFDIIAGTSIGAMNGAVLVYAEAFSLHGEHAFIGAFNWYRNIEYNNELLAPFRGGIDVPALYVVGDRDMVSSLRGSDGGPSLSDVFRGQAGSGNPLSAVGPQLRDPVVLPGCGHWTQQERPAEVNAALLDFLTRIDGIGPR